MNSMHMSLHQLRLETWSSFSDFLNSNRVTWVHRRRSKQILGVRKIFALLSSNVPERFSGNSLREYFPPYRSWTPSFGRQKKVQKRSSCDSAHVGRQCFKMKRRWAPFLPVFSGSLPRFPGICEHFHRFCPDFHQIKTFGGALTPLHPRFLRHCLSCHVLV